MRNSNLKLLAVASLALLLPAIGYFSMNIIERSATAPASKGSWCKPPESAELNEGVALAPMFDGRTFEKPVQVIQHPRDPETWFVVLHRGVVLRMDGADAREGEVVLDISDRILFGEQWGLQQVALHPRFPEDPRVFAAYFGHERTSTVAAIESSLEASVEAVAADARARVTVLIEERQPQDFHPIGGLTFGPDGFLYIGWGEGGLKQPDPTQLRSKLLRIDVDRTEHGRGYAVPPGNPFRDSPWRPEIYATGFRNPWRFTFDRLTGDLWMGDVGDSSFEEILRVEAGGDYGWPVWEGSACRLPDLCSSMPSLAAVHEHTHAEVCAVIGGYLYRGTAIDPLRGQYVYANGCAGTTYALDLTKSPPQPRRVLHPGINVSSLAEDADGELYAVVPYRHVDGRRDYTEGSVYKFIASPNSSSHDTASVRASKSLVELGCAVPAPIGWSVPDNLLEYDIVAPAWEDGAHIRRYMTTSSSPTRPGVEDSLAPPRRSVLLKTYFERERPAFTQMLARADDGGWQAYLFEWNGEASDAFEVEDGDESCLRCHNPQTGVLRALSVSQLNRDFDNRAQLDWLQEKRVIEVTAEGAIIPMLPVLDDESQDVGTRARVYLDVNCSSCHRPGGQSGLARFDLRRSTPLALMGLCEIDARVELPGHADAKLLDPGAPAQSTVLARMHATDLSAMPPGRKTVDPVGTRIIEAWIESLVDCEPALAEARALQLRQPSAASASHARDPPARAATAN